jgi:hypothetical protein
MNILQLTRYTGDESVELGILVVGRKQESFTTEGIEIIFVEESGFCH